MAIQLTHGQDIELSLNALENAVQLLLSQDFHLSSEYVRDKTIKIFKKEYRFLYNEALEDLRELQIEDLAKMYGLPI